MAERLFLPPIKESLKNEAKKPGVRISKRLLKQQQDKLAAKKREGMVLLRFSRDGLLLLSSHKLVISQKPYAGKGS
jgi:hypothetical protein